jgi:hypothetical protein
MCLFSNPARSNHPNEPQGATMNHPAAAWPFPSNKRPAEPLQLDGDRAPTRLTPPVPGELWPAMGGRYDGILRGDDGKAYHQISALPGDGEFLAAAWGERGKRVEGAESDRDGLTNTDAMAAAGSELAIKVRALRIAGFDDWHLPARHQAQLSYLHSGEHFDQDDVYWTSTQYSANNAWLQNFANGNQGHWDKDDELRARAVRRFSVIE